MKLIRFGPIAQEKPGVLIEGRRYSCAGALTASGYTDFNADFFRGGGLSTLAVLIGRDAHRQWPVVPDDVRWAAPVARPGKVVCIGLNYADHARESNAPIPTEPIVFLKASNTVVGPYDDVLIPRGSTKTDWEVELGVVIGADARYLSSIEDAAHCIAGYCISHDVSERAFQLERGGQWTKGKSCDTFNPLGPWLLTTDEAGNVDALSMSLNVNGQSRQRGSTATMIFRVQHIVHYLSQFMTLEAGDVITTGTPPGVGLGMKPPQYLKAGDVVELSIDSLGTQRQRFVPA